MRTILAAALALEPLSLHADGSSRGTVAYRAHITERNGNIRSHPVAWLAHSTSATPGFSKEPGERI
jgi:hypothetical protein